MPKSRNNKNNQYRKNRRIKDALLIDEIDNRTLEKDDNGNEKLVGSVDYMATLNSPLSIGAVVTGTVVSRYISNERRYHKKVNRLQEGIMNIRKRFEKLTGGDSEENDDTEQGLRDEMHLGLKAMRQTVTKAKRFKPVIGAYQARFRVIARERVTNSKPVKRTRHLSKHFQKAQSYQYDTLFEMC